MTQVPDVAARLRDRPAALAAALKRYGSDRAVAEAVGVWPGTIRLWRAAHGIGPATRNGRRAPAAAARLRDDPAAMAAALKRYGSDRAVAEAVGVTGPSVRRWRAEHGIAPATNRGRAAPAAATRLRDDADAMMDALTAHGSDVAVAEAVGVSAGTVRRWRAAHGIGPTSSQGHPVSDAAARLRDDADAMAAALKVYGSDRAVAEAVGVRRVTLSGWRHAHGIVSAQRSGSQVPDAAARLRDDPAAMAAAVAKHAARGAATDWAIGAEVGVSAVTVKGWRDRHGVQTRLEQVAVETNRLRTDGDAMRAALDEHGTVQAVAAAFMVRPVHVSEWCHAHGIGG